MLETNLLSPGNQYVKVILTKKVSFVVHFCVKCVTPKDSVIRLKVEEPQYISGIEKTKRGNSPTTFQCLPEMLYYFLTRRRTPQLQRFPNNYPLKNMKMGSHHMICIWGTKCLCLGSIQNITPKLPEKHTQK